MHDLETGSDQCSLFPLSARPQDPENVKSLNDIVPVRMFEWRAEDGCCSHLD